ncbi:MAG: CYTH domain-containing protein, partial [Leptospirales bacterium]|nr:CYTH domain-containing protein [Leptospirales bacterium]
MIECGYMMEIELKYAIPDKNIAEKIWQDSYLLEIEESGSREKLTLKAAYFDTEDGILAGNDIAFRVRMEGPRSFASLKWNGKNEGALHTREEVNVPIDGAARLIMPDPAIFKESGIGRQMMGLIEGKQLSSIMEVGFLRRRVRVDTGNSIIEISIDTGDIVADLGSTPICELELELFSGARDDLISIGEKFAARYSLIPEERSKYARGLMLAGRMTLIFRIWVCYFIND